jgi:hypothetical protein
LTASSGTKLQRSDLLKVSYPASERNASDLDAGEKFTFPALFYSGMRKHKTGTKPMGSELVAAENIVVGDLCTVD